MALVGLVEATILWDLSWHHTEGAGDLFNLPHPFIIPHFAILLAVGYMLFLPMRHLRATAGTDAARDNRATIVIRGRPRSAGATLACAGGVFGLVGLAWDAWWHVNFGRDPTHWTPAHLVSMAAPFFLVTGFLLIVADEERVALEAPGGSSVPLGWFTAAKLGGFAGLMAATDIYFSPWLQKSMATGFVPLSAGGFMLWMVAASRVTERRWSATLTTLLFLAWRELVSVSLVISTWDRPPHLGALLILAVTLDLGVIVRHRYIDSRWVDVVSAMFAAALYSIPAYVMALATVPESSLAVLPGTGRLLELTKASGEVVLYGPARVLLVIGLGTAAALFAGGAGLGYAWLLKSQRQLAMRMRGDGGTLRLRPSLRRF